MKSVKVTKTKKGYRWGNVGDVPSCACIFSKFYGKNVDLTELFKICENIKPHFQEAILNVDAGVGSKEDLEYIKQLSNFLNMNVIVK